MKYLIFLLYTFLLFLPQVLLRTSNQSQYSKYLNRFQHWPIKSLSTPANDWGNSATIYLDRHNINCGIGAINEFHYQRVGNLKFKYDYKCIMPKNCENNRYCVQKTIDYDKKKCLKKTTKLNVIPSQAGRHVNYLDRHYVNCDAPAKGSNKGYVLTQFHLARKPPLIQYDYTCCPAKVSNYKTIYTTWTKFDNYGSIYLDRQVVKVPDPKNQAIVGFKLDVNYGKKTFRYTVNVVNVTG